MTRAARVCVCMEYDFRCAADKTAAALGVAVAASSPFAVYSGVANALRDRHGAQCVHCIAAHCAVAAPHAENIRNRQQRDRERESGTQRQCGE